MAELDRDELLKNTIPYHEGACTGLAREAKELEAMAQSLSHLAQVIAGRERQYTRLLARVEAIAAADANEEASDAG